MLSSITYPPSCFPFQLCWIILRYCSRKLHGWLEGLKAWHLLHGRPWIVNAKELKATLDSATALAPDSLKCPKHIPFTVNILSPIRAFINLDDHRDVAIFACLTTTFYAVARLGKFTVPSIKSFSPSKHITCANVSKAFDRNGLPVTKFHIPITKTSPINGEDVFWAAQEGPSDPQAALENHFRINPAGEDVHLFA